MTVRLEQLKFIRLNNKSTSNTTINLIATKHNNSKNHHGRLLQDALWQGLHSGQQTLASDHRERKMGLQGQHNWDHRAHFTHPHRRFLGEHQQYKPLSCHRKE